MANAVILVGGIKSVKRYRRLRAADVFDERFGVNSAFNAEVFVAAPHAVAMEFGLFGERRSSHWVKGGCVLWNTFAVDWKIPPAGFL